MAERDCGKENILSVQMFGSFSLTWQGRQVMGGPKNRDSQSACLLQLLLHKREEGASRDQLEQVLFGEREVDDIRHAMRSVIYNTKKKLRLAGLPEGDYIRQENDVFYWTEEIAVDEDTRRFEELFFKAERKHEAKRLEYLLAACDCYKGEFLPQQAGTVWAVREARRYQGMFFRCVEEAAALLRKDEDWPRMKELGLHAARVSPFANWEVVTMEALVAMGQVGLARKLYEETVDFYIQEQGVRPSQRLLTSMGMDIHPRHAVLDTVCEDLREKESGQEGGYLCAYPVFEGLYQMVQRTLERSGQSVYLMMCTLVDSKGNPMREGSTVEKLLERMEQAICRAVRRGDAVARYSRGQYLVLLQNITREDCHIVQKRIDSHFMIGRQRTGIEYYVSCVDSKMQEGGRKS